MGCDIHIYVEKNTPAGWEAVYGPNPYIKDYEGYEKDAIARGETQRAHELCKYIKELKEKESTVLQGWIYNGRNYGLFSILAGVRNNYEIKPIAEPRGVPANASSEIREANEDWGVDGHSQSYFTFAEILAFDWENQSVQYEGLVDEEGYKKFRETGDPYPCCGGVGGGNVEIVLNYEMNRIIKNRYPWERDKQYYTAIRWTEKFSDIAGELLDNIKNYISENNISDLNAYRIVFWFDN